MLIASIDVGTVNLALAVVNSDSNAVVHMEIIELAELPPGGRTPFSDLSVVHLLRLFVQQRAALFSACTVVALEKQLIRKMVIVQFVLEATLAAHGVRYVVQVPPRNVKAYIGTSRGDYGKNKKAAVRKLRQLLGAEGERLLDERFPRKQDDVADAVLQGLYVAGNLPKVLGKWKHARRVIAPPTEEELAAIAAKKAKGKKKRAAARGTKKRKKKHN